MIETVKAFIGQYQLLRPGARYLVGVSGGADSVCLLLVLQQLGYQVEAVHCNFHLRAEESDRDEEFVKALCLKKGIHLHITHFDTKFYASTHKVSIEMAARQLRYHYFEQLRRDIRADGICVAHHRDDSVETILMNLLRGTGIHGLTGIKPRQGYVLRPLLCTDRTEIEAWLKAQQQPFVTDSTNFLTDILRNNLRHHVIPTLEQARHGALNGILATARRLSEAALLYDQAVDASLQRLLTFDADGHPVDAIPIDALLHEVSPESILYHWLTPKGFTPATIESIFEQLPRAAAGAHWTTATHQLTVWRQQLCCHPLLPKRPTLVVPEEGTYNYDDISKLYVDILDEFRIMREPWSASFCADAVRFPLTLRPVQAGDRFHPYGMKGTKLVSDYLTDRKVLPFLRQRQLVLTDADGNIIWLVGHRTDSRFCVSHNTRRTLIVTLCSVPTL